MMIVLCSAVSIANGKTLVPPAGDIAAALVHGAILIVLGTVMFNVASKTVPAVGMTIFAQSETVFVPMWIFLWFAERPNPATLLGGGIVLAAVVGKAVLRRPYLRRPRSAIPNSTSCRTCPTPVPARSPDTRAVPCGAAPVRAAAGCRGQQIAGRRAAHGEAASSWVARARSRPSCHGPPTNCIPIGSPAALWASGSEIAGSPVTFQTDVNTAIGYEFSSAITGSMSQPCHTDPTSGGSTVIVGVSSTSKSTPERLDDAPAHQLGPVDGRDVVERIQLDRLIPEGPVEWFE